MKKQKENKVSNEMEDFDDLSDLDFDSEFNIDGVDGIEEGERSPNSVRLAKELAAESSKDALKALATKTASKALPESYTTSYYDVKDYADFAKEEYSKSKEKINKSLSSFAKEAKKLVPEKLKFVNNFLDKFIEDTEGYRQESEEQIREAGIQNTLQSIFDKQVELSAQLQAKEDAEKEIDDKKETAKFNVTTDVLKDISNNISLQTSFTTQIAKEYYRKSLELQFKSYYAQIDLLKTTKDYYKGFSVQLDSVVKNTSLPEFVKLRNTERLSEILRTQALTDVYRNVFDSNAYITNVKNKMSRAVSNKIYDITSQIDEATNAMSMLAMGKESGDENILLRTLTGIAGSTLGEKAADKIAPKIREKIKDNETINRVGNLLETLSTSPQLFFETLRDRNLTYKSKLEGEDTIASGFMSKLTEMFDTVLTIAKPETIDTKVKGDQDLLSSHLPAIFDNRVHKSITEVIPMFLARILQENTTLRLMYAKKHPYVAEGIKVDELTYNYIKRKLDTKEGFKKSVEEQIFKGKGKKQVQALGRKVFGDFISPSKTAGMSRYKANREESEKKISKYLERAREVLGDKFSLDEAIVEHDKHRELLEYLELDADMKALIKEAQAQFNRQDQEKKKDLRRVYETTIEDSLTDYPISTVKEFFASVSRFARSSFINKLTNEEALIIAKSFSQHILSYGVITVEHLISAKAIENIELNEKLKSKLHIFSVELKTILNNPLLKSSFLALLGALNKAIFSNIDTDPNVLRRINEFSRELFKGKITIKNLTEGKLTTKDIPDDIEKVSTDFIKEYVNAKPRVIREAQEATKQDNILEVLQGKLITSTSTVYETLKQTGADIEQSVKYIAEAKKPEEMAKRILEVTQKATSQVTKSLSKAYENVNKTLDKTTNMINNLASKVTKKSKTTLLQNLNSYKQEIDKIVIAEETAYKNKIEILNVTINQITTNIAVDPETIREKNEKTIEKEKKLYEIKINFLKKIQSNLNSLISKVNELEPGTVDEGIKSIVDMFANIRNEFKAARDIFNKELGDVSTT